MMNFENLEEIFHKCRTDNATRRINVIKKPDNLKRILQRNRNPKKKNLENTNSQREVQEPYNQKETEYSLIMKNWEARQDAQIMNQGNMFLTELKRLEEERKNELRDIKKEINELKDKVKTTTKRQEKTSSYSLPHSDNETFLNYERDLEVRQVNALQRGKEESEEEDLEKEVFWNRVRSKIKARNLPGVKYECESQVIVVGQVLRSFNDLVKNFKSSSDIIRRAEKAATMFIELGISPRIFPQFFTNHCLSEAEKAKVSTATEGISTITNLMAALRTHILQGAGPIQEEDLASRYLIETFKQEFIDISTIAGECQKKARVIVAAQTDYSALPPLVLADRIETKAKEMLISAIEMYADKEIIQRCYEIRAFRHSKLKEIANAVMPLFEAKLRKHRTIKTNFRPQREYNEE